VAVGALVVQAMHLDIDLHQMAGFIPEKARQLFAIPDGQEPVSGIAMGYLGDPQSLPEDLRQRELAPSTRKPLEQFVFSGTWGAPAPWLQE
jgi:hypothetical protein